MKTFSFVYDGQAGRVTHFGIGSDFVQWAGMGFQIEAASVALRQAIEEARV